MGAGTSIKYTKHTRFIVGEIAGEHPFTTFLDPFPEGMKIARSIEKEVREEGGNIVDVIRAITLWVYDNITYVPDLLNHHKGEYFASPKLTLERGMGDCEDFAFLIASMLNSLKKKPKSVYVTVGIYKHIAEPSSYHAWTYIKDGIVAEGTAGWIAVKGDEKYNRYFPVFGIQRDAIYIFRPVQDMEKALGVKRSPFQINIMGSTIDLLPVATGVGTAVATTVATQGVKYGMEYAKKKGWLK